MHKHIDFFGDNPEEGHQDNWRNGVSEKRLKELNLFNLKREGLGMTEL